MAGRKSEDWGWNQVKYQDNYRSNICSLKKRANKLKGYGMQYSAMASAPGFDNGGVEERGRGNLWKLSKQYNGKVFSKEYQCKAYAGRVLCRVGSL